jgi:hypothetical protein
MNEVIKHHLARATLRMKQQADKGRSERHFQVDELVFVKQQPYIQSSLAPRSNQKLAFKYFGPFKVLQKVGDVAYKLELPPESKVHPIFHVSQSKKVVGSELYVSVDPPSIMDRFQVPEVML